MALDDVAPPCFDVVAEGGGFSVHVRPDGTGAWFTAAFLAFWTSFWTINCLILAVKALSRVKGVDYVALLWVALSSSVQWLFFGLMAWRTWSVSRFEFVDNKMAVEQSLVLWKRRRVFRRGKITAVRLLKVSENSGDTWEEWSLAVVVEAKAVRVLSRHPLDKIRRLGAMIARWADVALEPGGTTKPRGDDLIRPNLAESGCSEV